MTNTTHADSLPTHFLSFTEACESLGISRKELHSLIDNEEVETITTLDRHKFIVVGGALHSPFDELYELNMKGGE